MPSTSTTKDYYQILNISRTATQEEINKAYKHLMLEKTKDINEANEVLSNVEKRKMYDFNSQPTLLTPFSKEQKPEPTFVPFDINPFLKKKPIEKCTSFYDLKDKIESSYCDSFGVDILKDAIHLKVRDYFPEKKYHVQFRKNEVLITSHYYFLSYDEDLETLKEFSLIIRNNKIVHNHIHEKHHSRNEASVKPMAEREVNQIISRISERIEDLLKTKLFRLDKQDATVATSDLAFFHRQGTKLFSKDAENTCSTDNPYCKDFLSPGNVRLH